MKKQKRFLSFLLTIVMALSLTTPAFAAKIDTSRMPGHEILSLLPATLQRPARPTTAEQVDFRMFGAVNNEETWRLSQSRESVFQEIVELTDSLTAGKTTDREKMKAIYDWVSQNVKYGDASVSGDLYRNPFYVYVQRSGVCEGYANLCQLMCTIAEIPAVYISGAEKDAAPGGPGHAWNAALADGEWIFFDATWKEWDMAPNYHDASNYLFYFDGVFRTDAYPESATTYEVRMKLRSDFSCPARVTVPSGVTRVELPDCPSLTDVTLPDGVAYVYFPGCTGLTDVTLPDGVAYVNFHGCTGLRSINLPNGLVEIGNSAFGGCTALKSVTIPDSVTKLDHSAFSGTGLTSVTIPGSVTSMDTAFYECADLESVTIEKGVTSIDNLAFMECTALTDITIPDTVTSIGRQAFYGCTSLESVTIPEGVTTIGALAFFGCTNLKHADLPDSVTNLDPSAFAGCTNLQQGATLPAGMTTIPAYMFQDRTDLTSFTIPAGVTSIGNSAFRGCTSLKSVTIPSSVTTIEYGAFAGCTGLTSLTIPEGVTSIGNSATPYTLENIFIPTSVTSIGGYVLSGSLKDIYYAGTEAQWKAISIGEPSFPERFTVHYNSPMPEQSVQAVAHASTQTVKLDGKDVTFYVYQIAADGGNGSNYVKLRDLACALNGTAAQFEVDYDHSANCITLTGGQSYTVQGGEMEPNASGDQPCQPGNSALLVNGEAVQPEVYTINGYNYFKLRDLGRALDFNVSYIDGGIVISSSEPYSDAQ